jgi:RluA family pseudouridine synthase
VEILFSDDSLLVVDKPAGIPVQPDGWKPDAPYLVELLEERFGKLWVVHRLDKITSGVLLFARTAEAHRALSISFERRETRKVYHAIVNGEPGWDERKARHALRVNVGHNHRTVVDNGRGKPSETEFKVLKRSGGDGLLEVRPHTGRTHQIRIHAAALHHPLLGDVLYGAPPTDLIARPALHALSLTFTHPVSGSPVTFSAPYPDDFVNALERLGL